MFRSMALCGFFLFFQIGCATAGNKPVRIDFQSKQRTLCGFTFAAVKNLVIVAKPIAENSLKNRIDNERFDACPYWVDLTYKGLTMRLDFSRDVTFDHIKNIAENRSVSVALFAYDADGWRAESADLEIAKDAIVVQETGAGLAVSGILRRQIKGANAHEFCFGLVVIGAENYMIGMTCKPQRNQVASLGAVFRDKTVIVAAK